MLFYTNLNINIYFSYLFIHTCSVKYIFLNIYIYFSCLSNQGVAAMKIAQMTLSYTAPPTTSIAGIPGATACTEATVTENNWFLVSDAS